MTSSYGIIERHIQSALLQGEDDDRYPTYSMIIEMMPEDGWPIFYVINTRIKDKQSVIVGIQKDNILSYQETSFDLDDLAQTLGIHIDQLEERGGRYGGDWGTRNLEYTDGETQDDANGLRIQLSDFLSNV